MFWNDTLRELAILTFVTLDGVMQGVGSQHEDPSNQFVHGGWATDYWDEVMAQVRQHAMNKPYDMLFGRKTFELFATNRAKGADRDPVAIMMDDATKYVVSSSLTKTDWQNTSILAGDVVSEVSKLKQQNGPLLQIHGSWQLIQTLLAHDLVDEFRLWTFPVIVGSGKRPFELGNYPKELVLQKSQSTKNGVVMSIYRNA